MAMRKTQPTVNYALLERFSEHRIWHFLKVAKAKGESTAHFHHPVGNQANLTYTALFGLLNEMGMSVSQVRPECGFGKGIGLVEISNFDKVKTVLF